jgi:hypothetical protein
MDEKPSWGKFDGVGCRDSDNNCDQLVSTNERNFFRPFLFSSCRVISHNTGASFLSLLERAPIAPNLVRRLK